MEMCFPLRRSVPNMWREKKKSSWDTLAEGVLLLDWPSRMTQQATSQ